MTSSKSTSICERRLGPRVLEWRIDNVARRNAVAPVDLVWIRERCAELDGEIVVLTGEGDAAFCAGFDLKVLAVSKERTPDTTLKEATQAMGDARAVFIAAVNGPVVGAGVELAVCCDFRIVESAATFRVPAGRLGVVYHAEGLARIHAVLGGAITRRLLLAAHGVGAREVFEHGGADELVDGAQATRDRAVALAEEIGTLAPLSVIGNRRLLRALDRAVTLPPEVLAAHEAARAEAYASEDHAEARAAVAERRSPVFRGR